MFILIYLLILNVFLLFFLQALFMLVYNGDCFTLQGNSFIRNHSLDLTVDCSKHGRVLLP
jgi:hypothetical protein